MSYTPRPYLKTTRGRDAFLPFVKGREFEPGYRWLLSEWYTRGQGDSRLRNKNGYLVDFRREVIRNCTHVDSTESAEVQGADYLVSGANQLAKALRALGVTIAGSLLASDGGVPSLVRLSGSLAFQTRLMTAAFEQAKQDTRAERP